MMSRRIAISCLLVAVAACGSSDPIDVDGWEELHRRAYCERRVRCGAALDVDSCMEASPPFHAGQDAAGVHAGRMRFDADAAAACLAEYERGACDAEIQCLGVFTGLVADGGTCYGRDCATGYCDAFGVDTCMAGTCQALAPLGASCAGAVCVAGAWCDFNDLCVPPSSLGGGCDVFSFNSCAAGLLCDPSTLQCVRPAAHGAPCTVGTCHTLGDQCIDGTCQATPGLGGACGAEVQCQDPLVCAGGVCVAPAPIGASCTVAAFNCEPGSFCSDASVCEAWRADGMPCGSYLECDSGYCDQSTASPVCARWTCP